MNDATQPQHFTLRSGSSTSGPPPGPGSASAAAAAGCSWGPSRGTTVASAARCGARWASSCFSYQHARRPSGDRRRTAFALLLVRARRGRPRPGVPRLKVPQPGVPLPSQPGAALACASGLPARGASGFALAPGACAFVLPAPPAALPLPTRSRTTFPSRSVSRKRMCPRVTGPLKAMKRPSSEPVSTMVPTPLTGASKLRVKAANLKLFQTRMFCTLLFGDAGWKQFHTPPLEFFSAGSFFGYAGRPISAWSLAEADGVGSSTDVH